METYLLEGFFLEGRPTGPAFQDALAAHHQYIAQQVAAGSVLLAGPVPPGPRPGRHPGGENRRRRRLLPDRPLRPAGRAAV